MFDNGFNKSVCFPSYQKNLRVQQMHVIKNILECIGYELNSQHKSKISKGFFYDKLKIFSSKIELLFSILYSHIIWK